MEVCHERIHPGVGQPLDHMPSAHRLPACHTPTPSSTASSASASLLISACSHAQLPSTLTRGRSSTLTSTLCEDAGLGASPRPARAARRRAGPRFIPGRVPFCSASRVATAFAATAFAATTLAAVATLAATTLAATAFDATTLAAVATLAATTLAATTPSPPPPRHPRPRHPRHRHPRRRHPRRRRSLPLPSLPPSRGSHRWTGGGPGVGSERCLSRASSSRDRQVSCRVRPACLLGRRPPLPLWLPPPPPS